MLNAVLIVGVPMAMLLAAAIYLYRNSPSETTHGHGMITTRQPGTNARRRHYTGNRNQRDGQTMGTSNSGFADQKQCKICFEEVGTVQLYPCNHSDICESCVQVLLVSNQRKCPFCRSRFDGYCGGRTPAVVVPPKPTDW